jgi:hypothetical protein
MENIKIILEKDNETYTLVLENKELGCFSRIKFMIEDYKGSYVMKTKNDDFIGIIEKDEFNELLKELNK